MSKGFFKNLMRENCEIDQCYQWYKWFKFNRIRCNEQ